MSSRSTTLKHQPPITQPLVRFCTHRVVFPHDGALLLSSVGGSVLQSAVHPFGWGTFAKSARHRSRPLTYLLTESGCHQKVPLTVSEPALSVTSCTTTRLPAL